jgi:hypothetical protein
MNNYVLSYNPISPNVSHNQLLQFIKDNRKVSQYYQPFLGTYILKSTESLFSLSESFKGLFDGFPFMIVSFAAWASGGQMPPEIWTWIGHGVFPALQGNVPPPPPR